MTRHDLRQPNLAHPSPTHPRASLVRVNMLVVAALSMLAATSVGLSGNTAWANSPAGLSAGAPTDKVTCAKSYTVVAGDFWFGIAKKVGVTTAALLTANTATTATPLYPGNVLCLPDTATLPTATTTATTTATATTTIPPVTTGTGTTAVPADGSQVTTPTAPAAPAPVIPMVAFPVQGPCWFTNTWGAPRSGGRKHEGVDVIAKAGQYLYAVVDGTLTRQALDKPGSLSGNAWWLTGADGTYFFYAHLSTFAPDLAIGSKVVAGQIIGYVGGTGHAAGPHLHFEVHPGGGAPIDPTPTIKAVDGCKNRDPLPQPSGTLPPAPVPAAATTTTTTTATTTTTTTAIAPVGITTPNGGSLAPPTNTVPANVPPPSAPGELWQFIAPATAFDTSWAGTRLVARRATSISIANLAGVLSSTDGVMLRFTTKGASSSGYLVAHRCDIGAPASASLTFRAKGGSVGTTLVSVSNGSFCVTANVAVSIKVEIIAVRSATGVGLQAIPAVRALDTRTTQRLRRGAQVAIAPAALGVVPGMQAVSATITIVRPSGAGTLSVGFCGSGLWPAPISGDALSSFSIAMRVTSTGWCLSSTVDVDVVVDVTGLWAGADTPPTPIDPVRVFDSRSTGAPIGPTAVQVQVAGIGGVPAGAGSAVLAISTVSGSAAGIVFAVPCGGARSEGAVAASNPNRIVTAVVPVRLSGGAVCLSALFAVDVIVDAVAAA